MSMKLPFLLSLGSHGAQAGHEVQLSDMVDNSTSLREAIFGLIFLHTAGEQVAFPPKQVCFCLVRYGTSHLRAMSFRLL